MSDKGNVISIKKVEPVLSDFALQSMYKYTIQNWPPKSITEAFFLGAGMVRDFYEPKHREMLEHERSCVNKVGK